MSEALSDAVLGFLEREIDTVPHLEALLLLWQSAPEEWEVDKMAARIYVSRAQARAIFEDLVRRRLLSQDGSGQLYRFNREAETASLMPQVAESYRRSLVQISTFIHAKGSMSVREFARAFHIKGDADK